MITGCVDAVRMGGVEGGAYARKIRLQKGQSEASTPQAVRACRYFGTQAAVELLSVVESKGDDVRKHTSSSRTRVHANRPLMH